MYLLIYIIGFFVALVVQAYYSRKHYFIGGSDAMFNALVWPISGFMFVVDWFWDNVVNR